MEEAKQVVSLRRYQLFIRNPSAAATLRLSCQGLSYNILRHLTTVLVQNHSHMFTCPMFAEQTCTSPIASPFRGQLRERKCSQVSCLADLATLGHCHFKRMVSEVMEHMIHMSAYFFKIIRLYLLFFPRWSSVQIQGLRFRTIVQRGRAHSPV